MSQKKVVLDACVFTKLFVIEPDREQAVQLLKTLGQQHYSIIVPSLFTYEVMAVTTYAKLDVQKILMVLQTYRQNNMHLIEPDLEMLQTATAMTDQGHPKSGYPSFYDAIYHAMALCLACPFITADKRHYEKTKQLGRIVLLQDWEQVLE